MKRKVSYRWRAWVGVLSLAILFPLGLQNAVAQEPAPLGPPVPVDPGPTEQKVAVGIPSSRWGLGLGNGSTFSGFRFNFSDSGVRRVVGFNLALGKPGKNSSAVYTGLSCGLVGTSAHRINGLSLNVLGLGADRGNGLVGSLGITSGIELRGVGFGLVACSFLDTQGVSLAGMNVMGSRLRGLMVAGIGVVGDSLQGITISGVAAMGSEIKGVSICGSIIGQKVQGIHLGLGLLKSGEFSGLSAGLVHICEGKMSGLSIALFNHAQSLHGVQIGLLNHVGSGPAGLSWLPLVNARF